MLNFLPQKNKNMVVAEYLLRVAIFLLISAFFSILVLVSLFMPSFFFVNYKNDTINNQLKVAELNNIGKGDDPILFIKNINMLVTALSNTDDGANYSEIIDKIVSLKNKDIMISSIKVSGDAMTNSKKILISGVANTRDSLTSYEKEIKIDGFFDSVEFPVSDFIKSNDSDFSATLIYQK
jgi:hypothetical protein